MKWILTSSVALAVLVAAPVFSQRKATIENVPAGGKQYVAVTTSNGGGSPRNVPSVVAYDLHYPATGNALYVFALPERR